MTTQSKIDAIMEDMDKYSTILEDDGGTYEGYNVVNTYHIKEILTKHITDTPSEIEMDNRDNDLANIFNTTNTEDTKGDLYMRIIDYLVKKGFLQKGEGTPSECKHDFERQEGLGDRCIKCGCARPQLHRAEPKVSEGIEKLELEYMNDEIDLGFVLNNIRINIKRLADRINKQQSLS